MASMANFIPHELKMKIESAKEKESRLNYHEKSLNEMEKKMMICIQHKEVPQSTSEKMMTSITSLTDEQQQEEEYKCDDENDEEEDRLIAYYQELKLLGGALAPPPFNNIHPPDQQQQLLTSFTTTQDVGGYIDHSLLAASAVLELSALARDNHGIFWTNEGVLNQQHYQQTYPRPPTPPTSWIHASRASAVVSMEHSDLVNWLTTDYQWVKLFPSIVSEARYLRFLVKRSSSRNPDGSLQLMYTKLQATTPLLPKRTCTFLRTCKLIDHQTWVVADVPIDRSRNVGFPSGCLIRGMAPGFSQVTWVEHLEVEENYLDRNLYADLTCRGFAYGADRWVSCLERSCERRFFRVTYDILVPCLPGQEDAWLDEKKSVMKLSQRMVSHFCSNISFPAIKQKLLSCVPGSWNSMIYSELRQSPYHDDPKEMVIISATTFTLPYSPDIIFGILGDERTRHEWDASGKISPFTKPTCYTTGNDPRNKIYVYQTHRWIYNEVVLQEASVNPSGSLLVWSVLKSDELDIVKRGGRRRFPLIRLSGLAISSNNHWNTTSSGDTGGGSIVTLGLQQEFHDIKEIEPKLLNVVHSFLGETVRRIEAVLNKADAMTFSQRSPRFNLKPTRGSARGATAQTDQLGGSSLGFN